MMNPVAISLRCITSLRDMDALKDQWNSLLAQTRADTIFLTWEWLRSWWDAFGAGREPLVICGYVDGQLIGIAPFMKSTTTLFGVSLKTIGFMSSGDESLPDHLNVFARDEHQASFLRAVLEHVASPSLEWDILRFRDMVQDEGFSSAIGEAVKGRYTYDVLAAPENISPYLPLPGSWDDYLASVSSEARYSIRRKERAVEKNFDMGFSILQDKARLGAAFDDLEELHKKRMADKRETGSSLSAPFWSFHRDVAAKFFDNGWLMLGLLTADGAVIAGQYSFAYHGKAYYYQSGVDPAFFKYSAGTVVVGHMIRESIRRHLAEYDFLRGNESYKTHWTKQRRQCVEITVWNRRPLLRGLRAMAVIKSAIKNMVMRRGAA